MVVADQRMLGLMIRGGNEFGLGIYITGVDSGSVAENAGLKVSFCYPRVSGSIILVVLWNLRDYYRRQRSYGMVMFSLSLLCVSVRREWWRSHLTNTYDPQTSDMGPPWPQSPLETCLLEDPLVGTSGGRNMCNGWQAVVRILPECFLVSHVFRSIQFRRCLECPHSIFKASRIFMWLFSNSESIPRLPNSWHPFLGSPTCSLIPLYFPRI